MILITGVITLVVEFCGSIVVNIFLIFKSAVRFGTLALEIFLSIPLSCRRVTLMTKKKYYFVVPCLSLFQLMVIVTFILCKNGKYSV